MNADDLDEMYKKLDAMTEKMESLNEKMKEHDRQNPTQYISTLFIGGSADGQWRNIPERAAYHDVHIIFPPVTRYEPTGTYPDVTLQKHHERYCRVTLQDNTQRYSVMVLKGTQDNVIEQLIQGYRKL